MLTYTGSVCHACLHYTRHYLVSYFRPTPHLTCCQTALLNCFTPSHAHSRLPSTTTPERSPAPGNAPKWCLGYPALQLFTSDGYLQCNAHWECRDIAHLAWKWRFIVSFHQSVDIIIILHIVYFRKAVCKSLVLFRLITCIYMKTKWQKTLSKNMLYVCIIYSLVTK